MMTQVEALAKYATRASFADLSAESRSIANPYSGLAGLLHRRPRRRPRSGLSRSSR